MKTQSPIVRFLYFVMFTLMDVESLLWAIAGFIIWPFAKLRRFVASVLAELLKLNDQTKNNDKE